MEKLYFRNIRPTLNYREGVESLWQFIVKTLDGLAVLTEHSVLAALEQSSLTVEQMMPVFDWMLEVE